MARAFFACRANIHRRKHWCSGFAPDAVRAKLMVMTRILLRAGVAATAALGAMGCDRLSLGPPVAEPAPVTPAPEVDPELAAHAGETYSAFVAASGARYAPDLLGLNEADRDRLLRAMASERGGEVLTGGGAEALVFRGCAERGCAEGTAILAVDTATGAAFAGVRDTGGAVVLAPNDRLEALLRLNSPTRSWDDVASAPLAAPP